MTTKDVRWLRRCPQHKTQLVEDGDHFFCYKTTPPHEVIHPEVFDRWKRVIHTEGLPNNAQLPGGKKGGPGALHVRRSPPPPLPPEEKGQTMPEKLTVNVKKQKVAVLERAKYRGPTGEGLFLRLQRHTVAKGEVYLVRWQQAATVPGLGRKGSTAGVHAVDDDEATGRRHFRDAQLSAEKLGWVPIAVGGARRLELKPIPPPRKKPGRQPTKGRRTK